MSSAFTDKNIKIFWKPFLVLFLVAFLIINWNEISWIFNYRVVSGFFSGFFQKNDSLAMPDFFKENELKIAEFEYSEKENSLEIPKIEVSAPLIFVGEEKDVHQALNRGVVHFPGSVLPAEAGQTVILGHSAPSGWPEIRYDWVFSRLNELEDGDEIFVYFDNRKYPYSVVKKIFLERGEEIPENLTNSENTLILISCWPPGEDIRRIGIAAAINR